MSGRVTQGWRSTHHTSTVGCDVGLVVERPGLHGDDARRLDELRHDRRSARAAEAATHVHPVVVLAGLLVGLQRSRDRQLRLVGDEVDGERAAALSLAVIAVAHRRGDQVARELVGHLAAQATSGRWPRSDHSVTFPGRRDGPRRRQRM